MSQQQWNAAEAIRVFGVDPERVGIRHRGWWIVEEIDAEEEMAGAMPGDLCVKARDGAGNDIATAVNKYPNYKGTVEDLFDRTYRYYYFRPLTEDERKAAGVEEE